jgi:hypothetical protein
MGTPCLLWGAAAVAAFLVTFLAAEKSSSPAGRDPQSAGINQPPIKKTYKKSRADKVSPAFEFNVSGKIYAIERILLFIRLLVRAALLA